MVRTGMLASILRAFDAMDIDHRRSDYGDRFSRVLEFFYPSELPFWTNFEDISGLRIHCKPQVTLQVFASRELQDNMKFNDLEGMPLPWTVEQLTVSNETKVGRLFQKERSAEIDAAAHPKTHRAGKYPNGLPVSSETGLCLHLHGRSLRCW